MKNSPTNFFKKHVLKICLILIIATLYSCNPFEEEVQEAQLVENPEPWQDILEQLDMNPGIIVEKGGSIQEAIDVALPGDVIYISPGSYSEQITINKEEIRLIGLEGIDGEKVVIEAPGDIKLAGISKAEIYNIQHPNPNFQSRELSELKNGKANLRRRSNSISIERETLGNNIAHYTFKVSIGEEPWEQLVFHRVVAERKPFRIRKTKGEVFMIHGATQNFDDIFLSAGLTDKLDINENTSSPYYLAANGIDVWGIDLAWTNIPIEITDFSFMQDWGVEKDVDQVLTAMEIARLIRGLSGQSFSKLNLLGFSYGGIVAYAAAGRETQKHRISRNIKGLINADMAIKYEPGEIHRTYICDQAKVVKEALASGDYANKNGVLFSIIGELATKDPGGDHVGTPFEPFGFTNSKTAIFVAANSYFLDNNQGLAPYWHFFGGNSASAMSFASDLNYTDTLRMIELLRSLPPYQPNLQGYESRACQCGDLEVDFDDHFADIKVPVYYLGAAGGFGVQGLFSNTITNSTDLSSHIISKKSESERFKDFGHADLFMAGSAPEDAWYPLMDWLKNH